MKFLSASFLLLLSSLISTSTSTPTGLTPEQIEGLNSLAPREAQLLAQALQLQLLRKRSSPSGDYAPSELDCPAEPNTNGPGFIRDASNQSLNPQEIEYINAHRQSRQADWNTWLKRAGIPESDIPGGFDNFTSDASRLPRVGLALSGGGYRAMVSFILSVRR